MVFYDTPKFSKWDWYMIFLALLGSKEGMRYVAAFNAVKRRVAAFWMLLFGTWLAKVGKK